MKNALIVILIIAVLGVGGYFIYKSSYKNSSSNNTSNQTPTATNAVTISNFSFQPQGITVAAGTEVTWTNSDSTDHTIIGTGFDSGNLSKGGIFKHTFNTAGTFDYHCSIHPTMTGKVIVQ